MKDFIAHARKNLVPNRGRIQFFKDGQEFLPNVQAIATPGHTVGHTMFIITSGDKSICNIGDLTNHQILFTERPRTETHTTPTPSRRWRRASRCWTCWLRTGFRCSAITFRGPASAMSRSGVTASAIIPRRCRWRCSPVPRRGRLSTGRKELQV